MRLLHAIGCVVLGIVLCMGSDQAQGGGKDKTKETLKDMVAGKVKSVDSVKSMFTITLESGKDRMFAVDDATKFIGPKGGKGKGLKDDRMAKGFTVKVLPGKDGKTAKEVHLALRKKKTEKDNK